MTTAPNKLIESRKKKFSITKVTDVSLLMAGLSLKHRFLKAIFTKHNNLYKLN